MRTLGAGADVESASEYAQARRCFVSLATKSPGRYDPDPVVGICIHQGLPDLEPLIGIEGRRIQMIVQRG